MNVSIIFNEIRGNWLLFGFASVTIYVSRMLVEHL